MSNVITPDEMATATDHGASASPAKFVPYAKVLDELVSMQSIIEDDADVFVQLAALFGTLADVDDTEASALASLGQRLARNHSMTLWEILEATSEVSKSAKQTMPRKRWDDSGCPDDRPDDEDLAREAAAAVAPIDDEGSPSHV